MGFEPLSPLIARNLLILIHAKMGRFPGSRYTAGTRFRLTPHLFVELLPVADVLTVHSLALGRNKRGCKGHTKSVEVVSFCGFIGI